MLNVTLQDYREQKAAPKGITINIKYTSSSHISIYSMLHVIIKHEKHIRTHTVGGSRDLSCLVLILHTVYHEYYVHVHVWISFLCHL